MYPIDVPHLTKICTSHVPHSGPSVPHLGPDEMAALGTTLKLLQMKHLFYLNV